jgi:hypothetical protein
MLPQPSSQQLQHRLVAKRMRYAPPGRYGRMLVLVAEVVVVDAAIAIQ